MTREEIFAKVNAFVRERGWQTQEAGGATGATIAALEGMGLLKLPPSTQAPTPKTALEADAAASRRKQPTP